MVKVGVAAVVMTTYPLQNLVAVDVIWDEYIEPRVGNRNRKIKLLFEYLSRCALVLITCKYRTILSYKIYIFYISTESWISVALVIAVPNLGVLISFFGALCLAALGIIIPALIDLSVNWYRLTGLRKFVNIFQDVILTLFGLVAMISGTYSSIASFF